jgi:hypothetical protein
MRMRIDIKPFRSKWQLLPALWVASDLDHFEMPARQALHCGRDYACPDSAGRMRVFRRLDAHWLSWLHRRIEQARAQGVMHPTLAKRWNTILDWADNRFGPELVLRSLSQPPDARYRPPALPAAA